jgi:RNA polymerase sigma-70 factor, ECF subfamily
MDEASWIRALEADDEGAWTRLMDEYQQRVARYAATLWKISSSELDDVSQEVFRRIVLAVQRSGVGTSIGGLVYREARSACIDFLRKGGAGKRLPASSMISTAAGDGTREDGEEMDLDSFWAIPDEEAQRKDSVAFVDRSLGLLGQPCRELLLLRYMKELSQEELMAATGKLRGTVSSDVTRCKQALEKIMRKLWEDLGGENRCGFKLG